LQPACEHSQTKMDLPATSSLIELQFGSMPMPQSL
jgi:hypothetical protein